MSGENERTFAMQQATTPPETPEADKPSTTRRVIGYAIWGNRFRSLFDFLAWLGTKKGAAVATGALGTAALGTAVVVNPDLLGGRKAKTEATIERLSDDSSVYTIEGIDAAGRKARFELVVLANVYVWERGSTTQLMRKGEPIPAATLVDDVFTAEIRGRLDKASELIAAGAASEEGAVEVESKRALDRARTAATWIAAVEPGKKVSTLNLGQFKTTCQDAVAASDTAWQRPLIVIGIRGKDAGVNLEQALANSMTGKSNLPSPTCYTSFKVE
jgi:hypothetical protein